MHVISTTEPDNVEAVLSTHSADYDINIYKQISSSMLFGSSFFLRDGKKWKHSRELLQLCMTKSPVEDLRMFEVHVGNLIKALSKQDSGIDDLGIWFPRLIADITSEYLFGESMGTIEKPDSTGFLRALHEALVVYEEGCTLGPPTSGDPQKRFCDNYSENVKKIYEFIDQKVDDIFFLPNFTNTEQDSGNLEEKEKGCGSFLDELCNLTDDARLLRDESLTIFSATFEPVSALLTNLFSVLAKRPDLWELLRGEVGSLEGGVPDRSQLRAMKYHQFCLKECETSPLDLFPLLSLLSFR